MSFLLLSSSSSVSIRECSSTLYVEIPGNKIVAHTMQCHVISPKYLMILNWFLNPHPEEQGISRSPWSKSDEYLFLPVTVYYYTVPKKIEHTHEMCLGKYPMIFSSSFTDTGYLFYCHGALFHIPIILLLLLSSKHNFKHKNIFHTPNFSTVLKFC